jgi:hypothetical protein
LTEDVDIRNQVTYEWGIEELDWYEGCGNNPDIIDTDFAGRLAELDSGDLDKTHRLVLVVYIGNDKEGVLERGYAYPVSGLLPSRFTDTGETDGIFIRDRPKRFQAELDRWEKRKNENA